MKQGTQADPKASARSIPKRGAYVVTNFGGDRSRIVYARNPMEARRLGAAEDGDDERDCEVSRTPEWDNGYSTRDLLNAGWHWECGNCYVNCYADSPHLVVRDDVAYCSAACCIAELKRARAEREGIWRGLEIVTQEAPGAVIVRLFRNVAEEVIAEVIRPGAEHPTVERFCPTVSGIRNGAT